MIDLIARLERCYDAIPREGGARTERVGPFELFVREGTGWPFYARPHADARNITVADVEAVRARQREHGVPEAMEWVHDVTPSLLAAAEAAGLRVLQAPLMVLNVDKLPAMADLTGADVVLLDADAPDFGEQYAVSTAVAKIGFGALGTATGEAGPRERDAAVEATDPDRLAQAARGIRSGRTAEVVALTPADGVLARGGTQAALGCAEVVGVATLPSARRRGLGAAVTARLARNALDRGADIVFLSAMSDDVARVYGRLGFERVGTACIAEPR